MSVVSRGGLAAGGMSAMHGTWRKIEVQSLSLRIRIDFKPDRCGGKMTPQEFIAKWKPVNLSERSAAQQHFLDLCDLLGQLKPAAADPEGAWYCFEKGVRRTGGSMEAREACQA